MMDRLQMGNVGETEKMEGRLRPRLRSINVLEHLGLSCIIEGTREGWIPLTLFPLFRDSRI
jgi:hypothetical protein